MSTALVKYEAARKALAEAHRVDEVKAIHDKAEAMRVYAQQAQDTELQNMAAEIRLRAERRAGELLREMKDKRERRPEGGPGRGKKTVNGNDSFSKPSLLELGITRNQSSQWQKVASIPEEQFEASISTAREKQQEITTAAVLRWAAQPTIGILKPDRTWDVEDLIAEILAAIKNRVNLWPRAKSYRPLIVELRRYADVLEKREAS
jgi:hypothetical protein